MATSSPQPACPTARSTRWSGGWFGQDTVRAFALGGETDTDGNPPPADLLNVSNLHDADGNPVTVADATVRADTDTCGNQFAVISFPNGEEWWLQGVDPALLTPERLHAMGMPCFCSGTMISALQGDIAVEDLCVGDMVMTRDHGPRPIRWIGGRVLDSVDLALTHKLRPVRIQAGALGQNLPAIDLMVSPQHRILVRSNIAQRMLSTDEVLVAARQLTGIEGIEEVSVDHVEYFHVLFDRHEIVFSNGAETESRYTGTEVLNPLGQAACDEIFTLFPELRETPAELARPSLPGGKARR